MKNKIKSLPKLFSFLAIIFLLSGAFNLSNASGSPDYSGKWNISFYDASGKFIGGNTINVSEFDGSISGKTILNINSTVYLTEVNGTVISVSGKLKDGDITDNDKLEMTGKLTGSFTETEGSGEWKDYYGKGGTWKAKRPSKDDKRD